MSTNNAFRVDPLDRIAIEQEARRLRAEFTRELFSALRRRISAALHLSAVRGSRAHHA